MEFLADLQATGIAQALRQSRWAYPAVNVLHLLGLASLFGAILVLDLRMLGLWRGLDPDAIRRPAVRTAAAGLVVAVATGMLLFVVRAVEYAAMPVFWAKIGLVAAGTANALAARVSGLDRRAPRLTAAVSLAAWGGAIAAGRLIGYFGS